MAENNFYLFWVSTVISMRFSALSVFPTSFSSQGYHRLPMKWSFLHIVKALGEMFVLWLVSFLTYERCMLSDWFLVLITSSHWCLRRHLNFTCSSKRMFDTFCHSIALPQLETLFFTVHWIFITSGVWRSSSTHWGNRELGFSSELSA